MRRFFTVLWLIAPVALLAYHFGPGQPRLARDRAASYIASARAAEAKEDWDVAEAQYRKALEVLPTEDIDARLATRLARAKTMPYLGKLPEAMAESDAILEDALRDSRNIALQHEIRSTSATLHYYVAWLMRLEGADTEEWSEQTEIARQDFRLLAEESIEKDPQAADAHQRNLEAVIRLARMDISELKGMPLPSQCQGNGDCAGKCRSQKHARKKPPGKGNQPEDVRTQMKGAGQADRPGGGS